MVQQKPRSTRGTIRAVCWRLFPSGLRSNDGLHTAGIIRQYIHDIRIRASEWPPRNPDLNPINHIKK